MKHSCLWAPWIAGKQSFSLGLTMNPLCHTDILSLRTSWNGDFSPRKMFKKKSFVCPHSHRIIRSICIYYSYIASQSSWPLKWTAARLTGESSWIWYVTLATWHYFSQDEGCICIVLWSKATTLPFYSAFDMKMMHFWVFWPVRYAWGIN